MTEKEDAIGFRAYLSALRNRWMARGVNWPQYLFHFTDIANAARILDNNLLMSRSRISSSGHKFVDAASHDILSTTPQKWTHYVRFYFRPRTPTLYHNEGIRPVSEQKLKAHCPVPVYFLFDAESILCLEKSFFSHGSLASPSTALYSKLADFKKIPFDMVYHDEGFQKIDRDRIIHHRQAEVIYPDQIDLRYLRYIYCRSEAEKATLLHLLSDAAFEKWKSIITASPTPNLFYRHWLYVVNVTYSDELITFEFNLPSTSQPQKFVLELEIHTASGANFLLVADHFEPRRTIDKADISSLALPHKEDLYVTLRIDGHLAYKNRFQIYQSQDDLPF